MATFKDGIGIPSLIFKKISKKMTKASALDCLILATALAMGFELEWIFVSLPREPTLYTVLCKALMSRNEA